MTQSESKRNTQSPDFSLLSRQERNGIVKAVQLATGREWTAAQRGYLDEDMIPVEDKDLARILPDVFSEQLLDDQNLPPVQFTLAERRAVAAIAQLGGHNWSVFVSGDRYGWFDNSTNTLIDNSMLPHMLCQMFSKASPANPTPPGVM